MAGTFVCPFCQASYPIKPVLVGRQVRCSTCKKIFVLGANGIATGVEDEAPAPSVASQVAPPPPPAPPGGAPAPESPRRSPSSGRLTARQENIRKSMAATLSEAASKALQSETLRREEARQKSEQRRKEYRSNIENGVGDIKPAILTDYGVKEAVNDFRWYAAAAGVGLLILLIVLYNVIESPPRASLSALMTPVDGSAWAAPNRERTVQARSWLPNRTLPLVVNANKARISSKRSISLVGLTQVLNGELADHVHLAGPGLWVPSGRRQEVEDLWRSRSWVETDLQTGLAQQGIKSFSRAEVSDRLTTAGLSEQGLEIVDGLLYHDGAWAGEWLHKRQLPTGAELRTFNGRDGRLLKLVGLRAYNIEDGVEYRGRLLRLHGGTWTGEAPDGRAADAWRVWDMTTVGTDVLHYMP